MKVAITGNIASGKSQVEKFLTEEGFSVLDTDFVAHELLKMPQVQDKLIKSFGDDILKDNNISRPKLASIVFDNEEKKKNLENIIHPLVAQKIQEFFVLNKEEKLVFVSVPQLFEAKMENLFDKIILVYSDDEIRLQRLIQRNNMDKCMAQKRLSSQISQQAKLELSDFVIENNDTINVLNSKIKNVITHLLHS